MIGCRRHEATQFLGRTNAVSFAGKARYTKRRMYVHELERGFSRLSRREDWGCSQKKATRQRLIVYRAISTPLFS